MKEELSLSKAPAPWRPKPRDRPVPPPPPESPSASTRASCGYESGTGSRVSSPDKEVATGGLSSSAASTPPKRGFHHPPQHHEADHEETDALGLGSTASLRSVCSGSVIPCVADVVQYATGDDAFRDMVLQGVANRTLHLTLVPDSCGGTYLVRPVAATIPIAVFKPAAEEIGQEANPHGNTESERMDHFTPGTGYKREILAYRLDHENSAGVPQTVDITIDGRVGSLQRFVPGCSESADHMPGRFPKDDVHRIALLDLRLLNGDRHGGNILVKSVKSGDGSALLVPIDHSYVAPSGFADPEFEWAMWPQTKEPFSPEVLQYIARLDPERDRSVVDALLSEDEEAAEVVCAATTVLQIAALRGYTVRQIAAWVRRETLTQPSKFEQALTACRSTLDDGGALDMQRFRALVQESFPPLN